MKTRNLLFALALPAAFAACSQDEFATEESGVSLAGRKSIGEITLVTDAQTRFSIDGNGFGFNNEDALSAALIDRPYSGVSAWHDYAYDNYAVTDYISSNYKFEYKGGSWSSKATMVEGNYIFLAPYVNHSVRNPMEATLPAEQNLKLDASGKIDKKSAIQEVLDGKNPVFIAHRFLAADGGTEQGINFYNIYSYPMITVKNTDALRKEVIVKKVLLKNNKGFMLNAPFSNKKVRNALVNEVFAPKGEDTKDQALMGAWAKVESKNFGVKAGYDGKNTEAGQDLPATLKLTTVTNINTDATVKSEKTTWYNGLTGKTTDLLVDEDDAKMIKGDYIVINFPGDGYKLKFGESVSFNAVVPADDYQMGDDGDLEMYVVVNTSVEGTTVDKVWKKNVQSRSQELTLYPGKSYPFQDYNGASLRPNKGGYFTILTGTEADGDVEPSEEFKGTFASVGAVTTTEELKNAIEGITSNTEQVIIVNGKNVKFNKAVNEAVANTACQKITIQGLVYFDASDYADKKMTVSNRIAFEEAVIENGEVVFNKGNNTLGDVIVLPKAALEISSLADNSNTILNYGKLKLATAKAAERVYNHGELGIAADMKDATIYNLYKACTDDSIYHRVHGVGEKLMLSTPVNLNPSVHVMAGGTYAVGNVKDKNGKIIFTNKLINYPITVDAETAPGRGDAGKLVLRDDGAEIVKDKDNHKGKIINNGMISGADTDQPLVVNSGLEMTNNSGAEVDAVVEIKGASHTLAELESTPVKPSEYTKAAKVTNSGKMKKKVVVDGLLVMGAANARVDGTITMTPSQEGEIDNTAKGVLVSTVTTDAPVVFAKFPSMDISTDELLEKMKEEVESYASESVQVKTFRLTGPMNLGNGDKTWTKVNGETIELMPGSSVMMGDGTFTFDCIKASAIVKCSGRTTNTSILNITSFEKGQYLTVEDGMYTAKEGEMRVDDAGTCTVTGAE